MANIFRLFLFLLILTGVCAGLSRQAVAAVTLRSTTEVSRPVVNLSDVFDGLPDGIDCAVARAPAPGHDITYDVHVLTHLVQQYNLDWKPASLADHTVIKTIGSKITGEAIREAVAEKIKTIDVRGDVDVIFDNHALELTVPGATADFTLNNFEYDASLKRFHADLVAEGFSGSMNVPLSGHINIRHNVPVLVRRLEAGSLVGASDIDWVSVPEDHMAGLVTSAEDLVNHELRRDQDADQPVHARDITPQRLVTRGSLVTMKIETPFMTVTAEGRALQDGKIGDVVRLNNTQSNRMIEGIVEGPALVRIHAGQRIAAVDTSEKQE